MQSFWRSQTKTRPRRRCVPDHRRSAAWSSASRRLGLSAGYKLGAWHHCSSSSSQLSPSSQSCASLSACAGCFRSRPPFRTQNEEMSLMDSLPPVQPSLPPSQVCPLLFSSHFVFSFGLGPSDIRAATSKKQLKLLGDGCCGNSSQQKQRGRCLQSSPSIVANMFGKQAKSAPASMAWASCFSFFFRSCPKLFPANTLSSYLGWVSGNLKAQLIGKSGTTPFEETQQPEAETSVPDPATRCDVFSGLWPSPQKKQASKPTGLMRGAFWCLTPDCNRSAPAVRARSAAFRILGRDHF